MNVLSRIGILVCLGVVAWPAEIMAQEDTPERLPLPAPITLAIDSYYSPRMGAEDLLFVWHAYDWIDKQIIPDRLLSGEGVLEHVTNGFYRAVKIFLIDYPFSYLTLGLQHEFFGHKSHYDYSSAIYSASVSLSFPPPFSATGFVPFTTLVGLEDSTYTAQDSMILDAAGVNASRVFANRLQRHFLLRNELSPHLSLLYAEVANDFSGYSLFGTLVTSNSDIDGYRSSFADYATTRNVSISDGDIIALAILDIVLDPFFYYSIYNLFVDYLILGNDDGHIFTIPLGPIGYLPGYYVTLSPYGVAHNIKNYVLWNGTLFDATVHFPHVSYRPFWGASVGVYQFDPVRYAGGPSFIEFDLFVALWHQPELRYTVHGDSRTKAEGVGVLGSIVVYLHPPEWERFALFGEFGYKSAGFWEGYFPGEMVFWQVGFSIR